ncbi:MAG: hypothetical protein ACRD5B_13740, partial [Nitrososphaeraceae archaeon]
EIEDRCHYAIRHQIRNEQLYLWIQMNFYLNPDGPANHTGSNTRVDAYKVVNGKRSVKITTND